MNLSQYVKNPQEIDAMRRAGRSAASVLEYIEPHVKPGVTTNTLNELCHQYIIDTLDAVPAPLNYRGFPKSICTSPNHVVCHGIPNDKPLKNGDILNIDITVIKDGFHGDTSKMFLIGQTRPHARQLCQIARECLITGIKMVRPGESIFNIGQAIEQHANRNHFSSVRDYCGHGIGREFHEPNFQILHYAAPSQKKMILEPGLTFTIEPMINIGGYHTKVMHDQWTVLTSDKSLSAQWEHTILVTETGYEVLTLRENESI